MIKFWKSKKSFSIWYITFPDTFYYNRVHGYKIRSVTLYDWLRIR